MNQDNLHPMNRSDFPQPDWNSPEWNPLAYPPREEIPGLLPKLPPGITMEQYKALTQEAKAEGLRRWPTLADYLNYQYDESICKSKVFPYFEPKRIVPPGGYPSPKCVAAQLFCTVSEVTMKYNEDMPVAPTEVTALLLSYALLAEHVPVFYVSDAFIRAVAATDLPGDFTLQDLHWPMPAMAIGFPSKFLREITGRDIGYVFAANLEEGDHSPPSWCAGLGLPTIRCPAKMAFQYHTYNGVIESYVTSWLNRERLDEVVTKYEYTDYTEGPPEKVDDDKRTTEKIGALLLKLLVVLNTRPGYVETHKLQRPAKINKRTRLLEQTALWSPNIIGFKYVPQRQDAPVGIHASPRWHWRRGHITHQRIGSHKSPDFVSIAALAAIEDGPHKGEVDWLKVPAETRAAFWRSHARRWLEPTLINFDEHQS